MSRLVALNPIKTTMKPIISYYIKPFLNAMKCQFPLQIRASNPEKTQPREWAWDISGERRHSDQLDLTLVRLSEIIYGSFFSHQWELRRSLQLITNPILIWNGWTIPPDIMCYSSEIPHPNPILIWNSWSRGWGYILPSPFWVMTSVMISAFFMAKTMEFPWCHGVILWC